MAELKMPELREQGAKLGLKFPPGTSKVQAAEQIEKAKAEKEAPRPSPPASPVEDVTATEQAKAEHDAQPAPDAAPASAEPLKKGDRVDIVKINENGDWWCPVCDHSQTEHITECQGCHAQRVGDAVKA